MTTLSNSAFEKEAKEKWGHTQAYREYEKKHHAKQTPDTLTEGMDLIMAEFSLCMKKGETPDSAEAQRLVKALQNYITARYYHCTNAILAGLGQMYVADERFQHNIDSHAAGTAAFICDAITAYCRN